MMDNTENFIVIDAGEKAAPQTISNATSNSTLVNTNSPVSEIRCQECDAVFEKWFELMQHTSEMHQQVHAGQDNNGVSSANEDVAENSMVVDAKLRTTWCHICKKHLATVSSRNLHMRIHTGVRPFVCNICGKSFTQNVHLRSHISVHTGAKPHICKICNKGFVASRTLKIHMLRNHSNDSNSLTCPWCAIKFVDKDQLIAHTLASHADESPTPPPHSAADVDADGSPLASSEEPTMALEDNSQIDDESPLSMVKTSSVGNVSGAHSSKAPGVSPSANGDNAKKRRISKIENSDSKCFQKSLSYRQSVADDLDPNVSVTTGELHSRIPCHAKVHSGAESSSIKQDDTPDVLSPSPPLTAVVTSAPPLQLRIATGTSRRKCALVSRCSPTSFASSAAGFASRLSNVAFPPAAVIQHYQARPPNVGQKNADVAAALISDANNANTPFTNMRCPPNVVLRSRTDQRLNSVRLGEENGRVAPAFANHDSKINNFYQHISQQASFFDDFSSTASPNPPISLNTSGSGRCSSPAGNGVGTSVKACPNCLVVEGELQLMKAEMGMIKQFLANKLTLMEQKVDNMQTLIRQ